MRFERRGPLPMRPLPFFGGWLLVVLGLLRGPAWVWTTTRFSGNILVQILVPRKLLALDAENWLWLVLGGVGLVLVLWSHIPSPADPLGGARGLPLVGSRFVFYPFLCLLGLFLLTFGCIYLFDASVNASTAPGGFATFVYLDYANLFARPIQSIFGGLIVAAALAALTRSIAPAPSRATVTPATPPAAPRRTVLPVGGPTTSRTETPRT